MIWGVEPRGGAENGGRGTSLVVPSMRTAQGEMGRFSTNQLSFIPIYLIGTARARRAWQPWPRWRR